MWFLIAILGYFLLAGVFILDKFILTKSVGKPIVYTFYSTILMFGVLLAWPLGVGWLSGIDWFWATVSGLAFGFSVWTLFISLKKGEASHIGPFNGAVVTIATYIFAAYFLGERLSQAQGFGIGILIFASLLLSFEKTRKRNGFHIGFVWAMASGAFTSISLVSAKYLYTIYPFLTAFVWSKSLAGFVGLLVLFFPSVRRHLRENRWQKNKTGTRKTIGLVGLDKGLAVLGIILIQYAAALGSVSLVSALSGLQFVLVFILVYLLTKFIPKLFKEYFTKRELMVEAVAILLVVFGSALFVI